MATATWVESDATSWVEHKEGTQNMLTLENHYQRRMIMRLEGQQKLQVFSKLGK